MTEKIMINGVDVSGCYFYDERPHCPLSLDGFCRDEPDCYYKQLQRKTVECAELKQEITQLQELNSCLHNQRETYYAEFIKIKGKLQIATEALSKGFDLIGCLSPENTVDENIIKDYIELTNKALEGIKEC